VGRDVSVVGFDHGDVAPLLTPGLTTVERDLGRIGAAAVELLLARLEGDRAAPPRRVTVPTTLVVRGSCAPGAAAAGAPAARAAGGQP
jgi:LacI family transcriptional regulator